MQRKTDIGLFTKSSYMEVGCIALGPGLHWRATFLGRNVETKGSALALSRAFSPNPTTVEFHKLPAQRQTEARSLVNLGGRIAGLFKWVENPTYFMGL